MDRGAIVGSNSHHSIEKQYYNANHSTTTAAVKFNTNLNDLRISWNQSLLNTAGSNIKKAINPTIDKWGGF